MRGKISFDVLREIAGLVDTPLCAAGELPPRPLPKRSPTAPTSWWWAARSPSANATAATRAIRTALDTGQKADMPLFRRATSGTIREILSQVSAANVSDAMHRGGVAPGIHPLAPGLRCCGRAVTVRTAPGDWAKPVEAIDLAGPGDVLVIDAGGVAPATWGELATNSAIGRGIEGVVIDGPAARYRQYAPARLPRFCRCHLPQCRQARRPGRDRGGLSASATPMVAPGDWILADDDGVVVPPAGQSGGDDEPRHERAGTGKPHPRRNPPGQHVEQGGGIAEVGKGGVKYDLPVDCAAVA